MQPESLPRLCNHLWQPYADADRIWQTCAKCGTEEHVTTHAEQLAQTIDYIMDGADSHGY